MFLAHSDKARALEAYGAGALGPDRAQESKTVGCRQVVDSFTVTNPTTCLACLEGVLEALKTSPIDLI